MSLGVAIKGPEGIVLAADSRITLEARRGQSAVIPVTFDNTSKLLAFGGEHRFVGAVTYGAAVIGTHPNNLRTAFSYLPEIEASVLPDKRTSVEEYAKLLSNFYLDQWKAIMPDDYNGPPMTFIVGGMDEGQPYGKVFLFDIPYKPELDERNKTDFGVTWGGQREIATRLIYGYDPALPELIKKTLDLDDEQMKKAAEAIRVLQIPVPYSILPLQDCVDLAIFLIKTTIQAQSLAIVLRGVGGPIDVATITRDEGLSFVQRKQIHGEVG